MSFARWKGIEEIWQGKPDVLQRMELNIGWVKDQVLAKEAKGLLFMQEHGRCKLENRICAEHNIKWLYYFLSNIK